MVKLIALDLDGTLLNSQNEISTKNRDVLQYYIKLGCYIVLSSGRPYSSIEKFIKALGINNKRNYTIAFNGCKICNNYYKDPLYSKLISDDIVKKAYDLSKELNVSFFAYDINEAICYQDYTADIEFEENLAKLSSRQVVFKSNINAYNYVKMTFASSKEILDKIYNKILLQFGNEYNVIRTHDKLLEIFNKDASKGKALEYLQEKLEISKDETIAFGDNENDISLLKAAKYRIVMDNSTSIALREIATKIAPSNDNDGVGVILEELKKS